MTDTERFQWLATVKVNSIHLGRDDDHACNYRTASEWIDDELADHDSEYHEVMPDELQVMRDTNTIWSLQIYPDTPIGSYRWVGATMASVIGKAYALWAPQQRFP